MQRKALAFLLAVLMLAAVMPAAAAAADDGRQFRFQGKVRWVESLGTYALLADDG